MELPKIDEQLVDRLAEIASLLDENNASPDSELLIEFNQLAGTSLTFLEFQGVYGSMDHRDFVIQVLMREKAQAVDNLSRDDLIEIFKKIKNDPCDDSYLAFALSTIKKTFGDTEVSDLIFWPGEYIGDGDNSRELRPEEMADLVLEKYRHQKS